MKTATPYDFGFDINLARANLVDWLVQAEVVRADQVAQRTKSRRTPIDLEASRNTLIERGEDSKRNQQLTQFWQSTAATRAAASDEDVAWAIAEDIGHLHAAQHGIPTEIVTKSAEGEKRTQSVQCPELPCKIAGVSFALLELTVARRENRTAEALIGRDLAELAKLLRKATPLAQHVETVAREKAEHHRKLAQYFRPGALRESHWGECAELLAAIEPVTQAVGELSLSVRENLQSPELRGRPTKTRGRKKRALLTGIWQHLDSIGFTRRETSELVPDDNPIRDPDACIDRVRKTITGPDCRTIRPWVPEGLDDDGSAGAIEGGDK